MTKGALLSMDVIGKAMQKGSDMTMALAQTPVYGKRTITHRKLKGGGTKTVIKRKEIRAWEVILGGALLVGAYGVYTIAQAFGTNPFQENVKSVFEYTGSGLQNAWDAYNKWVEEHIVFWD